MKKWLPPVEFLLLLIGAAGIDGPGGSIQPTGVAMVLVGAAGLLISSRKEIGHDG